jgi:thymidine phosphorylase
MDFEEFIRKMTKSAKDSNVHIMAFISDGERVIFTFLGNERVITEATAIAMVRHPQARDTICDAMDLIESRKMKVTVIDNEDQMNDYLIDRHLKSKKLNNSQEGL